MLHLPDIGSLDSAIQAIAGHIDAYVIYGGDLSGAGIRSNGKLSISA